MIAEACPCHLHHAPAKHRVNFGVVQPQAAHTRKLPSLSALPLVLVVLAAGLVTASPLPEETDASDWVTITQAGCHCLHKWKDMLGKEYSGCANPNDDPQVIRCTHVWTAHARGRVSLQT